MRALEVLEHNLRFFLWGSFGRLQTIENHALRWRAWLRGFVSDGHGGILLNSIPKSGTHLLERLINSMPSLYRSGHFISHVHHGIVEQSLNDNRRVLIRLPNKAVISTHMPFSALDRDLLADLHFKHVLLLRDPRALAVSQYFHAIKRPTNRLHQSLSSTTKEQALWKLINGFEFNYLGRSYVQPPLDKYFSSFCRWLDTGAHLIKFEDIVGSRGGGCDQRQFNAVVGLASYLGLEITDEYAEMVGRQSFSEKANTYRTGHISEWKRHITQLQSKEICRRCETQMAMLKYQE